MSRSFRRFGAVAVCIFLVGFGVTLVYKSQHRLNANSSIDLSDEALEAATNAAKSGDANAAAKLSRHFLVKKQYKPAYAWMLRAKELGDPGAESDLNEMRKFFPPDAIAETTQPTGH